MSAMGNQGEMEPRAARDAAEFVALMRQLKERQGLTYRQLEQRAADRGEVLARSTLADALRQDTLPRAETLRTFLRACGEEARAGEWLEAWNDLAAHRAPGVRSCRAEPETAGPKSPVDNDTEPDPVPRARRGVPRGRLVGAVLGLLAVGGASLVVAMKSGDSGPSARKAGAVASTAPTTPAAPAAPPPGTYRIRSVVSSLCLSERRSEDGGNISQSDCRRSIPVYALEGSQDDTYRIRSLHPVLGYGCLGVGHGSSEGGAQMMDDYCGHRGTAERFRIERVTTPVRGYRIRPVHTGDCVALPGGSTRAGSPVLQLPCRTGDTGQIFRFDPVRAPTAIPTITSN
jgi:transcriptional regulator with XRE-family HTH domain